MDDIKSPAGHLGSMMIRYCGINTGVGNETQIDLSLSTSSRIVNLAGFYPHFQRWERGKD